MVRRKGELASAALDRQYPHQVIVPWQVLRGGNYHFVHYFCDGLSVAPRGHAVVKDDTTGTWWVEVEYKEFETGIPERVEKA